MTSQISGKVVGIRLEQDECSEREHDNVTHWLHNNINKFVIVLQVHVRLI